jgi:cytoskeletal protein CcmA (bactofilin family)
MFNNNTDKKNKTLPKVESYIAHDTVICGTINATNGTLRIDGEVNGEIIKSYGIVVGEKGKIKANLEANMVIIAGEVIGNVVATERVEVLNNAKLIGDLEAPILSIAEGCIFHGNCKMTQNSQNNDNNPK